MRFDLFEQLSPSEAKELLQQFLEDGVAGVDHVRTVAAQSGIEADYSLETLSDVLHWAFSQVRTVPIAPDLTVPEWIRSTPDYESTLFEFDDDSKNLICIVAYYLGECFVRTYPQLRWATGNTEFATGNMPVVTGFKRVSDLAPMLVVENLFSRLTRKPERTNDFATAIETWRGYLE